MKDRVFDGAALVLTDGDNVTAALGDLDDRREVRGGDWMVTLTDSVLFGHKFALDSLPTGGTVRKYGEVIGRTAATVAAGEWIHTHNRESTRGRGDVAAEVER